MPRAVDGSHKMFLQPAQRGPHLQQRGRRLSAASLGFRLSVSLLPFYLSPSSSRNPHPPLPLWFFGDRILLCNQACTQPTILLPQPPRVPHAITFSSLESHPKACLRAPPETQNFAISGHRQTDTLEPRTHSTLVPPGRQGTEPE